MGTITQHVKQFSLHEKINFRSHFETKDLRALAPYCRDARRKVLNCGHSVFKFKTECYGVRIDGTTFNKRGSMLKC